MCLGAPTNERVLAEQAIRRADAAAAAGFECNFYACKRIISRLFFFVVVLDALRVMRRELRSFFFFTFLGTTLCLGGERG